MNASKEKGQQTICCPHAMPVRPLPPEGGSHKGGILCHAVPWHFLYFLPLPHGHGSLRPTFGSSRFTWRVTSSPPVRAGIGGPFLAGAGAAAPPPSAPNGEGADADGELSVICCGGRRG